MVIFFFFWEIENQFLLGFLSQQVRGMQENTIHAHTNGQISLPQPSVVVGDWRNHCTTVICTKLTYFFILFYVIYMYIFIYVCTEEGVDSISLYM